MGGEKYEQGKTGSREEGLSPNDKRTDRHKPEGWPRELNTTASGWDVGNSGTQPSKGSVPISTLAAREELETVELKLVCTNQGSL